MNNAREAVALPLRCWISVDPDLINRLEAALREDPDQLVSWGANRWRIAIPDGGLELKVFSRDRNGRLAPFPDGEAPMLYVEGQVTPQGMVAGGRTMEREEVERVMAHWVAGNRRADQPPAPNRGTPVPAAGQQDLEAAEARGGEDEPGPDENDDGDEAEHGQLSLLE